MPGKGTIDASRIKEIEWIEEFLKEQRLCWLGYVMRTEKGRRPIKAMDLTVQGSKKSRRDVMTFWK